MMASYSALWRYHMRRGQLDQAQNAALGLLQAHHRNMGHYTALARAALDKGHLDTAAQFAGKAFANIPNGKDVRVYQGADGRLGCEVRDDRSGEVVRKGILTPQEIGAWVMGTTPDKFDELAYQLAGQEMPKPEKPKTDRD
jgi:tetratricopeptide (TPR) repeat protein